MNLKKALIMAVCTAVVIFAASCSKAKSTSEPETDIATVAVTDAVSASGSSDGGFDVDLTELSSTMVYSEVYNMIFYPESYIGKTVKMKGMYVMYEDEKTGKKYHGCIISDATACCSQGIEFELTHDYNYPDDYPSQAQEICVAGTFHVYMEGTDRYCTLRDGQLVRQD